jgi:hypothetical protein
LQDETGENGLESIVEIKYRRTARHSYQWENAREQLSRCDSI